MEAVSEIVVKTCLWCGAPKLLSEFSKEKKNRSGRAGHCLECHRKHSKKYSPGQWNDPHKRVRKSFCSIRHHAKKVGRAFTITLDEFKAVVSNPCHYCGGPLPQWHGGLDRKDNSKGYEPSNVLPCCVWCNRARNSDLTVDEMERIVGPAIRRVREEREKSAIS